MPAKLHGVSSKNTEILGQFIFLEGGGERRHLKQERQCAENCGAFAWPLLQWKRNNAFCSPPPTLSHKRNCFRSEFIEDKVHVFIFSITFCKECLILRWIHRNIIINERRFSSGVPIILVRFESNLIFPYRFSNHPQILNFVYVRPVGAELFHPDGHTWLN